MTQGVLEDHGAGVGLTAREAEILQLVADGCSRLTIAERLFISRRTVQNHLTAAYAKLDARDDLTAVLRALRLGLVILRDSADVEPDENGHLT